ncbi:signal peptidase I [Candidatus Roizmanbacteria bacterium]|nr:signal peptidase I [Candidatus Roizmanbacteria bacterium]
MAVFGSLVAIGILVAFLTLPILGNSKVLVVLSGSMTPAIPVGSLILSRPNVHHPSPISSPLYSIGQIVSLKQQKNQIVTHRITDATLLDNHWYYSTKGDANNQPDTYTTLESDIIGKVFFTIPYLGHLVGFAKTKQGIGILVIIPALFVMMSEVISIMRGLRIRLGTAAFLLIGALSGSLTLIGVTHAFFSDTAASTNNIFQADESFGPPIAQTLVMNEFLWNSSCSPNADQKFWIELFNGSSSTENLKDWQFRDADGTVIQISNANHNIAPGEYRLITKSASTFTGCYVNQGGVAVLNLGGNPDFSPGATGGVIKLEKPIGESFEVVDRIEYGPTLNGGALNTLNDQSIARIPNGVDSALGDTFAVTDFEVSTLSAGIANP